MKIYLLVVFQLLIFLRVLHADQNDSTSIPFLENNLDSIVLHLTSLNHIDTAITIDRHLSRFEYNRGYFGFDKTQTIFYYKNVHLYLSKDKDFYNKTMPFIIGLEERYQGYDSLYIVTGIKERLEQQKQYQEQLIKIKQKYPKYYSDIINHKYWIGMTKDMLIASIGRPMEINRTITASVTHEQWIYKDKYIYFDNDKLTAIQD